ncbi:prolyl 4-hydroxylase subunit alpha-1-like [Drosophila obscura]|uniref:prolyl 4-hydroxylase subunit alpha-1-like n=1 Tax=Drosophila obscura TaxID=7282 RepID=UPI001BB1DBDF|nr:prolyl 4-hydroxylase subunit alpha-1-like [Drosophila obscura]
MRRFLPILSILFIAIMARCESNSRYAYSNAEMVSLLGLKKFLVTDLNVYVTMLQENLNAVELAIKQIEIEVQQLEENHIEKEFNGIRQFSFMRHLHSDWPQWLRFMRQEVALEWQNHVQEIRPYLPTKVDLDEACKAIYILIEIYGLSVDDFSRGLINGKQYKSKSFDAMDCFALARNGFEKRYFDRAEAWFEAIWLTDDNAELHRVMGFDLAHVLQLYARNLFNLDKKELALQMLQETLTLGTDDQRVLRQLKLMERGDLKPTKLETEGKTLEFERYFQGCRGLFDPPQGLSCHYDFNTHPVLRLAPLKVEPLNRDPYVAIYHDVIYDSEIEELKRHALPDLKRSKVYNLVLQGEKSDSARTSTSSFQTDHQNKAVTAVNRRVMHMTGFEVEKIGSSDKLLIINYGTGGQYMPHRDYFGPKYNKYIERGDRIATALFYLNDVEQGGKTVFPYLEISCTPIKGSALVFHSMNSSYHGEARSLHGGCPVLVGSKWAATKWIYNAEQMFQWPCVKTN